MNKKFSIILNSRARPEYLINLLKSIEANTANLEEIEVLVSLDNDDKTTQFSSAFSMYKQELIQWGIDTFVFDSIPREKNLHIRLNDLSQKSTGKFIWVLNDDTEIITKNWDLLVWPLIESLQNDTIYVGTTDNSCDKEKSAEYSSFPMVSRVAVDKLGYFMNPNIVGLGADVHLWRIYNTINKVIKVPINIRHILHETVKLVLNPDQTATEMRSNSYQNNFDFWNCDISDDINKLILK